MQPMSHTPVKETATHLALLHRGVYVQDGLVADGEDGVVLQQLHNHQLGLELGHHGHGVLDAGQHKAGRDVRLLCSGHPQAEVLTAARRVRLFFVTEDRIHLHLEPVGMGEASEVGWMRGGVSRYERGAGLGVWQVGWVGEHLNG